MKSKIIQEFKAEINGIEINNKDIYWEVEYILGDIENTLNIELPRKFVKDFTDAYERIYNSIEPEYLYDFKCYMVRSWDPEIKDIKELQFNLADFYYRIEEFDSINEKISDWDNTYGKK